MLTSLKNFLREQFLLSEQSGDDPDKHSLELATAVLAIEIARADDTVSPEERHHIAQVVARHFHLTAAEAERIVALADAWQEEAVSLYEYTRTLNEGLSSYRERIEIVRLLWEIAWADSRIHKHEEYFLRKIADLLYVSHRDYIRTKLAVAEQRGEKGKE